MEIHALLMDPKDNVVTCVKDVQTGMEVVYRNGDAYLTVTATADVPYCHKVALVDLKKGEEVYKYGELIGVVTADVQKGGLIDHNNLVSVPRDYASEYVPVGDGK